MAVSSEPTHVTPATSTETDATPVGSPEAIDARTRIGAVHLTVQDLARSRDFYERVIGLRPAERDDGSLAFGVDGERPLVHLYGDAVAAGLDRFYNGVLGFDAVVRTYPGALFVSAGGYHPRIGLNTWNSAGSGPPAPGAVGLRHYEILLPEENALQQTVARVHAAGVAAEPVGDGAHLILDPSGNGVVLRTP